MAGRSTFFASALLAGCCGFAAGGAMAAESGGNANPMAGSVPAKPSQQGGGDYSSIERDPFRACVAAHQNDPNVQQNCTWEGKYQPKR